MTNFKKYIFFVLLLTNLLKMYGFDNVYKEYNATLIVPDFRTGICQKDCFTNMYTKYIVDVPNFNYSHLKTHDCNNLLLYAAITGLEDFENNPWQSSFCPDKSITQVYLPLNYLKKMDQDGFLRQGEILCLIVRDTKNNRVKINLTIHEKHNPIQDCYDNYHNKDFFYNGDEKIGCVIL